MTQSEHMATSNNPSPVREASRSASAPLIAVFIAAAFVASSWFFYQQGQRDAAVGNTETVPVATQDAMTSQSETIAQQAATNDSTATSAPSDDSAQSSVPGDTAEPSAKQADAANTGAVAKPAARVVKAKPVAKRSLALSAKPAPSVAAEPLNREVALLGRPKPVYPSHALHEREQGTVLVLAQVDVQGHVSDARVIQRSGSYALDRAATREVRNWQFQPALQNGQPVVASVQVPVSYRLEQ
jgi:TonB family protein